jgi:hypothetical protein
MKTKDYFSSGSYSSGGPTRNLAPTSMALGFIGALKLPQDKAIVFEKEFIYILLIECY